MLKTIIEIILCGVLIPLVIIASRERGRRLALHSQTLPSLKRYILEIPAFFVGISLVMLFRFFVIKTPNVESLSNSISNTLYAFISVVIALLALVEIPMRLAYRHYKKKLERSKQKLERSGLRFPGIWLK